VVATYDGQPRNPVLLAAPVWTAVAGAATGDVGARGWLRTARRETPDQVVDVECGDLGYATDLDTPADLADLEGLSVAVEPSG
jgi:nicotine blue oxidoreductase